MTGLSASGGLFGQKLCFSLDFYFPARIKEPFHDDHRSGRVNVAEKLAVCATDALPIGRIDGEDPGPNDIFEGSTESFNRLEDDFVASFCLIIGIAGHRLSVGAERRRPGNDDAGATPHGASKPDQALVRGRRVDASNRQFIIVLAHLRLLYSRQSTGQVNETGEPASDSPVVSSQRSGLPAMYVDRPVDCLE